MKILILGAGGVGGYFGAHLVDAKVDVTFLVRARRAAQLREHGLTVHGQRDPLHIARVSILEPGETRGPFDVVILSCKAYDLASSIESIRPYMSSTSFVLPLLNGVRHLHTLDETFGASRVLGGLAQVSTTLLPNGEIQQFTATQVLIQGARESSQIAFAEQLHQTMQGAQFDARLSQQIILEMWEKFFFLASLAAATCLLHANIGEIINTTDGKQLVLQLINDCGAIITAEGFAPRESAWEMTRKSLTLPGSLLQASMRRDLEQDRSTEAEHVLGDMLRRANRHHIESPLLRAAYCQLQAHQQRLAASLANASLTNAPGTA